MSKHNKMIVVDRIQDRIHTIRGLQVMLNRDLAALYQIETRVLNQAVKLDLEKHNAQYPGVEIKKFSQSHDRFLIIDDSSLYHFAAFILSPFFMSVAAIRLTITSTEVSGCPRQFIEITENIRCSILFHLLVSDGKWQTQMFSSASSANFCNAIF